MMEWMESRIDQAVARRDWAVLPADFEADAVKALYHNFLPHFRKDEIRPRILASKARTFAELRKACEGKA